MTWLVLVASVLAGPSSMGQMSNPLRVYGADDREYLVTFVPGGVEFEGHAFVAMGGNRFRYEAEPSNCEMPAPHRVETVLRLVDRGVEIKTSEVSSPCSGPKTTAQYTRRLSFFKASGTPTCKAGLRDFHQGGSRIGLDARCDGTLVLTAADAPPLRMTETRRAHFVGAVGRLKATVTVTGPDTVRVRLVTPRGTLAGQFEANSP